MELLTSWGGDGLLLAGRRCLAVIFAVSAVSKFRQTPAEIKVLANLHIPALSFWSQADPPPVRAQKLNAFAANIAIVGGLIYVIAAGPGRLAFVQ